MRILKVLFSNTNLIVFVFVLLSVLSTITITNFFVSLFFLILFSIVTTGYTLYNRKWFLCIISTIIYIPIYFIFYIIQLFSHIPEIKPKIVGEDFYIKEIKTFTNITLNPSMKLIAKRDTIHFYWNSNDYDAECLYVGSQEIIHEIIELLNKNESFKKVESLKLPTIKRVKNELNVKEIDLIFKKEIKGKERIYMAFDSSNTKVYYSAVHYE